MAVYMEYEGVPGAVTATGYEKWIALESVEVSSTRNIEQITGDVMNRARNLPQWEMVKIAKQADAASEGLITSAMQGKGVTVKIDVVEPGDKPTPYVQYELTNTIIASFESSSDGDQPSESYELSFTKIKVWFVTHDAQGKQVKSGGITYDLEKSALA